MKKIITGIFLCVLIVLIYVSFVLLQDRVSKIVFLDVGQGDAIYMRIDGIDMVVDGGRHEDVVEKISSHMPFYDRKIEYLFLTHSDIDHIGGLPSVIEKYRIETLLESGVVCKKDICSEWEKLKEEKNVQSKYVSDGDVFEADNFSIEVLHPDKNMIGKKVEDLNEESIVLCLSLGEFTILLMGDAGIDTEEKLLSKQGLGACAQSSIVKIGHHGSKTASSKSFLEIIKPKYAIISAGEDNPYGHPHYDVLKNIEAVGADIVETSKYGSIEFKLFENEIIRIDEK